MKDSGGALLPPRPRHSKLPLTILICLTFYIFYFIFLRDPSSIQPFSFTNSATIQSKLIESELGYQLYVKKRNALVKGDPSKVNPWPPPGVHMYFYDYFLPAFNCPHTIQRIGSMGDGGKWVCGFELFEKQRENEVRRQNGYEDRACVVYSFGVAGESSYEAEFLERTNCLIYGFDASVNQMGPPIVNSNSPRIHFNKVFIGNETKESRKTLGTIMKENGHKWIDFFKMDIEGGEFDVFDQIFKEFEILPFGQLQLEIHGDQDGKLFPTVYKMWEKMEAKGLRAFKNEVNHWPCVGLKQRPFLVEYSFINIKGDHRLIS